MVSQETEYKLSSLANIQFKYNVIESGSVIQQKLDVLCKALEIKLGSVEYKKYQDDYYDDEKKALKHAAISFRYRKKNELDRVVTLKIEDSTQKTFEGKVRKEDEFECVDEDFKLLLDPSKLEKRILKSFGVPIRVDKLEHLVSVFNERSSFQIDTGSAKYEICFDKYYYRDPKLNTYSEIFGEVEIELEGNTSLPADEKLTKLRSVLTELFCYSPNSGTKLERGIEWIKDPTKATKVYTLAFDIVGFSKANSDEQKNNILHLNHFAKIAVKEHRGDESVIYLPTGDGMLMVFEDRPETLLPIVISMQKQLQTHLKQSNVGGAFRTGMHCGEAFKYSDVNENLNYAGAGINMAVRVMDQGAAWQVLATNEAYQAIGVTFSQFSKLFKFYRKAKVKHDVEIDIYNIHDSSIGLGIPN